jgi:predicted RNA-binding protein YlxR (DUF448 family)
VRIVRTPAGSVEVDPTGKKNGRGAYLHADPACWDLALKRKALQHALKTEIGAADRAALDAFRATLPAVDAATAEPAAGVAGPPPPDAEQRAAPAMPAGAAAGGVPPAVSTHVVVRSGRAAPAARAAAGRAARAESNRESR